MRREKAYHDAERFDRAFRPYDLVLRLEGSDGEWNFGRFGKSEDAHAVGIQCLGYTRPSDLPFGRKCANYWVIDSRTGQRVARELTATAAD